MINAVDPRPTGVPTETTARADAEQFASEQLEPAPEATPAKSAPKVTTHLRGTVDVTRAATTATNLDPAQPELPDAREEPASTTQTRGFLASLDGFGDYAAFYSIQQGQMKSLALAATLKRNAQQAVTEASFQSVRDMLAQVKGERLSATFQLAGSLLGAATSTLTAGAGKVMRGASSEATRAFGAGLDNAGAQLGSVVSGAVNVVDKQLGLGGEFQAQQARLAQKASDVQRSIAQQIADGARSAYDQADKALSNAMQAFSDYFKRKEGLMGNIANQ